MKEVTGLVSNSYMLFLDAAWPTNPTLTAMAAIRLKTILALLSTGSV